VKFCNAKRTHVPVGPAKFDVNRCNKSPLPGEKPDFWPVSKFNTSSLPLRGNPAGKKHHLKGNRVPAGYCHTSTHDTGGVNNYLNSNHMKYLAQLSGHFSAFWKISTANL